MDASWVDDYRRYLNEDERECMAHIRNNTFEEQPFTEYFSHWEGYLMFLNMYPEKPDLYDCSNLPQIAAYYNEHTRTTTCYDVRTGKKGTQSPKYYSSSTSSSSDTSSTKESSSSSSKEREFWTKWFPIIAIAAFLLGMLRGCAEGETLDAKKVKELAKKAGIEWMDENYIPSKIEAEVIRPSDYPIRRLTIK